MEGDAASPFLGRAEKKFWLQLHSISVLSLTVVFYRAIRPSVNKCVCTWLIEIAGALPSSSKT